MGKTTREQKKLIAVAKRAFAIAENAIKEAGLEIYISHESVNIVESGFSGLARKADSVDYDKIVTSFPHGFSGGGI